MSLAQDREDAKRGAAVSLRFTSASPSPHPGAPARSGPSRARPHDGPGPCTPVGGRCPSCHRRCAQLFLPLLAAALSAALLAACGGAGGGPSSSPSAEPTPLPSPRITSGTPPAGAVDVVREFWKMAGDGRLGEAKRFLVTADSSIQQWTGDDIADARLVHVVPHSVSLAPKATVEFAADVWIRPSSGVTPWGDTGTHQLFENVVRMSDGTWRLVESGTGP